MKQLIIYHAHCCDGIGAAWAAWSNLKENNEVELFAAAYGKEPPWDKINQDTVVHILDFSYSPEITVEICKRAYAVTWIDHHKSAIDAWGQFGVTDIWPENLQTLLDIKRSGAMLAWHYYHLGKEVPLLIKHIEDRDLWKFQYPETNLIHLNLNTFDKNVEQFDVIAQQLEVAEGYYDFVAEGKAIDRYYQQAIKNILATNKVECYIDGVRGLACNCPGQFASDVGHQLANESGTYGFTWEENKGGKEKISLRSNGDYDIGVIATSFGGGGHRNAAGFVLAPNDPNASRIKFKPLP